MMSDTAEKPTSATIKARVTSPFWFGLERRDGPMTIGIGPSRVAEVGETVELSASDFHGLVVRGKVEPAD
jgi:hypothetical protein